MVCYKDDGREVCDNSPVVIGRKQFCFFGQRCDLIVDYFGQHASWDYGINNFDLLLILSRQFARGK